MSQPPPPPFGNNGNSARPPYPPGPMGSSGPPPPNSIMRPGYRPPPNATGRPMTANGAPPVQPRPAVPSSPYNNNNNINGRPTAGFAGPPPQRPYQQPPMQMTPQNNQQFNQQQPVMQFQPQNNQQFNQPQPPLQTLPQNYQQFNQQQPAMQGPPQNNQPLNRPPMGPGTMQRPLVPQRPPGQDYARPNINNQNNPINNNMNYINGNGQQYSPGTAVAQQEQQSQQQGVGVGGFSSPGSLGYGQGGLVAGMQNLNMQQPSQPSTTARSKRVYNTIQASGSANNGAPPGAEPPLQNPQNQPPQPSQPPAPGSARSGYTNTPVSSQNKIDPAQIPSPVVLFQTEQEYFSVNPYKTNPRGFSDTSPPSPPSSVLDYFVIDDGNCSPRFVRATTYALPTTSDLANTVAIPLGLIIQPLAELRDDEVPLQIADFGEAGPLRCSRCRGYINCHVTFIDGGRRYRCNLCSQENEVPNDYFCNLDSQGIRCDLDSRPELKYGSVEFTVPKDFILRPPVPLSYVFALDVSWQSQQSGLLKCAIQAVREAIARLPTHENAHYNKIAIITFDRSVHFYNLSPKLSQPQMLVVPEVQDVFSPLSEGFLVNPTDAKESIDSLLNLIPKIFENNRTPESCMFSAVKAIQLSLRDHGGRIIVFQSSLANYGLHSLKPRDDSRLVGTDKERSAYTPQDGSYKQLGEECSSSGVSVDLIFATNGPVDLASASIVSTLTSGSLYHYHNFHVAKDSNRLIEDIIKMIKRPFGYDGLMRIRCSNGFSVSDHLGNFNMKNSTDIEIAGFDSEKAIAVQLKHDGKLEDETFAHFQCALVYTTSYGRRLMRVHNLVVGCSSQVSQIFRNSDVDAVVNFIARGSATQALVNNSKTVRDNLNQKCVSILAMYRKYCSSGSSPGQLVLPESLKVLPIYTLALQKTRALRGGMEVNVDLRISYIRALKSSSSRAVLTYLYPRLFPLHYLPPEFGELDLNGKVLLPNTVRLYAEKLDSNGLYLLENGFNLYLWLGKDLSQDYIQAVFQVSNASAINVQMTKLPALSNPISTQIRSIIDSIMANSSRGLSLTIIRQQVDPWEVDFLNLLVEDKGSESTSYVDYLCQLHRQIYSEVHNT